MSIEQDFFNEKEYSDKIFFLFKNGNAVSMAYTTLERHLKAAEIQIHRIWSSIPKAQESVESLNPPKSFKEQSQYLRQVRKLYDPVFIDIHFYFISWNGIRRMIKFFSKILELKINEVFPEISGMFQSHKDIRDAIEHFDERLPGEKYEHRVKEIIQSPGCAPSKIYGGISSDGCYLFGDKKIDIKLESFLTLKKMTIEIIDHINQIVDDLIKSKKT